MVGNINIARTANATSFKKGQSGNPEGRPKGPRRNLREMLEPNIPAYFNTLHRLATNQNVKPSIQLQAVSLCLAYAVGKPETTSNLSITGSAGIQVQHLLAVQNANALVIDNDSNLNLQDHSTQPMVPNPVHMVENTPDEVTLAPPAPPMPELPDHAWSAACKAAAAVVDSR